MNDHRPASVSGGFFYLKVIVFERGGDLERRKIIDLKQTGTPMKTKMYFSSLALLSSLMAGQVLASGSNLPVVEEVTLNLGNPQAILPLENASKSGKISDFKIKTAATHIQFAGLSGKLACGVLQGTRPHPARPSGKGGKPVLYYGVVSEQIKAGLYSVDSPEFTIDSYERVSKYKSKGHKKISTGNAPYTFKIPVSKMTKAGVETSIDPVIAFNTAMQKYMNQGGTKLDFLKNDQLIILPAYLSLRAECWSSYGHYAYDVKPVSVVLSYKGDKTLKYTTTVQTGDNNAVKLPLYVTDASIHVMPGQTIGQCPRKIAAKAVIKFNQKPEKKRLYKARFLEDGVPATEWYELGLRKKSEVPLVHYITVKEDKKQAGGNKVLSKATGNQTGPVLNLPQVIKNKPTVAIEVKADGNSHRMAVAQYVANCLQPLKAKPSIADPKENKPDLTSRIGMKIGNKTTSWGGSLILDATDFTSVTSRGCKARFKYDVVNIGKADASGFNSRLRRSGTSAHLQSAMQLKKGQTKNVSGSLLLAAGTYPITASIDDAKTVSEARENNNVFKVMVTVPQICGGAKPRPQ